MAQALPGAGAERTARRAPSRLALHLRGRHSSGGNQPGLPQQANRWQHQLERSDFDCSDRDLQVRGSPLTADPLAAAAPAEIVQALHCPVRCREGAGYRWHVPKPARQGDGALCRREKPGPGS